MTDRELVFALFGLLGSSTDLTLASLELLNKDVPISTVNACRKEMDVLVNNLATLSKPQAEAFLKDMIEQMRRER